MYKKIATCLLLCGVSHNCMSMELVAGVVGGAVGLVQSGYKTVNAKMHPTEIFNVIHAQWPQAEPGYKLTLLHLLDRGYRDGFLQEKDGDLTKLLDAIEGTVPTYPICEQTLQMVHGFLQVKLPVLSRRPDLLKRAVTALYLLQPDRLAPDIKNQTFTNTITDLVEREQIVSSVIKTLILRENAKQANILVQTLQGRSQEVPFSTHAQTTLKAFLAAAAVSSLNSCEFIDSLGNTKKEDPINQQLATGRATMQQIATQLQQVQQSQGEEEQRLRGQLEAAVQLKRRQLDALIAEQQQAEQQLREQMEAARTAKAQAEQQLREQQQAAQQQQQVVPDEALQQRSAAQQQQQQASPSAVNKAGAPQQQGQRSPAPNKANQAKDTKNT